MSKKYKLTGETMLYKGHTLHRIVALKDFGNVLEEEKGGWVGSEENLSQDGDCWVADKAKVYDLAEVTGDAVVYHNARVYDKAQVYGSARVYDDAVVYGEAHVYDKAQVYDHARVYDDAGVYGEAHVFGNAQVYGSARVYDDAAVYGEAHVYCNARVYDNARVYGKARVCGEAQVIANAILRDGITKSEDDYIVVGPQGSRRSCATYHIPTDTVCTGCFVGTLKEFEASVEETHKDNARCLQQYRRVIRVFNMYKSNDGADPSEIIANPNTQPCPHIHAKPKAHSMS